MFPVLLQILGELRKKGEAAKPEMPGPKPCVSPEAARALTLWLADATGMNPGIEEISEVLFGLGENKGYKPPYLAMRRIAGGEVISEDVAEWVGWLIGIGYTRSRLGDPIELGKDGIRVCRQVLDDERRLNKELDFFLLTHAILELLQKYQPR